MKRLITFLCRRKISQLEDRIEYLGSVITRAQARLAGVRWEYDMAYIDRAITVLLDQCAQKNALCEKLSSEVQKVSCENERLRREKVELIEKYCGKN